MEISREEKIQMMAIEVDKDHLYILINYLTTRALVDIIKNLKIKSTFSIYITNNNYFFLQ